MQLQESRSTLSGDTNLRFTTRPGTIDGWVVDEVLSGVYWNNLPIQPNSVVVDVGAHIGAFSLAVLNIADRIYAFEPHPDNYKYLLKNIADNVGFKILPSNKALSDKPGQGFLGQDVLNTGGHHLSGTGGVPITISTLDDEVPYADYLKIDAEGSELKVLQGGQKLLTSAHPRIAMEIHSDELRLSVTSYLENLGYTVKSEPYMLQWLLWAWKK